MNIIFIGAPGAGKGTQSEFISRHFGIPAISTGNIIRKAVKDGTPLGKQVKSYMDNGTLVPTSLSLTLLRKDSPSRTAKTASSSTGSRAR
jgi:adenylate kinase